MTKIVMMLMMTAMAVSSAIGQVGWRNLDDAHHLCGRKASEGYLQGRVVMVVTSTNEVTRMEGLWLRLKERPFTMLGSFGAAVEGVTFPVYRDAELGRMVPMGSVYVVDVRGNVRYKGDDEREAIDIVLKVLTDWDTPETLAQWTKCLNWEIWNSPAAAILRFEEFQKSHPNESAAYQARIATLSQQEGMGELVKLVRLSRRIQQFRAKNATEQCKLVARIESAIEQFSHLKNLNDPQMAREAKNAIAELTWVGKDV